MPKLPFAGDPPLAFSLWSNSSVTLAVDIAG